MKGGKRIVLSHHPSIGLADFLHWIRGKPNQVRVPVIYGAVTPSHALGDLNQRMLNVTRMPFVVQVLGHLLVGKRASEPGVPPEQEGHEHDQPCSQKKQ